MTAENSQMPSAGLTGLLMTSVEPNAINFSPLIGVAPITKSMLGGFGPGNDPKPFVIGHNQNEGGFFIPDPDTMTATDYSTWLTNEFGATRARSVLALRQENDQQPYNPTNYTYDAVAAMTPAAQAMMRTITDSMVATPSLLMSEQAAPALAATKLSQFGYQFSEVASFNYQGFQRCSPESKNVCHSYELPFVFNNFVAMDKEGTYAPATGTPDENALAIAMSRSWAGFAKDPAAGWGHPPLTDPLTGPYVNWKTQPESINDMAERINYEFWKPYIQSVANQI